MAGKILAVKNDPATTATTISGDMNPVHVERVTSFISQLGVSDPTLPGGADRLKDSYSELVRSLLTVDSVSRGKVCCSFTVVPALVNAHKGLNGGVVAVLAERVAVACARTVVAEDKQLFTGEVSLSFLSAAPIHAEVTEEASLLRSGRNLTAVSTEFRIKKSRKLVYTSHATFFHISGASTL